MMRDESPWGKAGRICKATHLYEFTNLQIKWTICLEISLFKGIPKHNVHKGISKQNVHKVVSKQNVPHYEYFVWKSIYDHFVWKSIYEHFQLSINECFVGNSFMNILFGLGTYCLEIHFKSNVQTKCS